MTPIPPLPRRRMRLGVAAALGTTAIVSLPFAFGQSTQADFDGEVPNRIADTRESEPRGRLSDGETMEIALARSR